MFFFLHGHVTKYALFSRSYFYLYFLCIFQQLEHDFEVLFKGAENRMLTHWPQFSAKVKRELINIGVREENIGEEIIFFLEFLTVYVSLSS